VIELNELDQNTIPKQKEDQVHYESFAMISMKDKVPKGLKKKL